tara:strand:+ start:959 stop:1714 length:756 start_codon:yes stop_codon:yes gene_type:complete
MGYEMILRYGIVLFLYFFCFSSLTYSYFSIVKTPNGMKSIVATPNQYSNKKQYPMLIVLHGIKEDMHLSYRRFKSIADTFQMILVCPEGSDYEQAYLRQGTDDLAQVAWLYKHLQKKYSIDQRSVYLVGFSRGGNVALELGMRYPNLFQNIVSFFGFFNYNFIQSYMKEFPLEIWQKNRFYLITGKGDLTEQSMRRAYAFFNEKNIVSQLWIYDDLIHSLPKNMSFVFSEIIDSKRSLKPRILALKNGTDI